MSFILSDRHDSLDALLDDRAPGESEFQQAVREVSADIIPIIHQNEAYKRHNIFQRLIEPERVIVFGVTWQNDQGGFEVNRGYRVQFNSAIGPYKGGLRFTPDVNLSVLKFLGFEQTLKNALTGLPMGGAKGGADFDPSGRSDAEIMRFCNAFMQQLHRNIGSDRDVPAGDINVGDAEIGYLFGAYKRITQTFDAALTGKSLAVGGSALRTEATGFGVIYFLQRMLESHDATLEDKRVLISGAGNVALHSAEKALALGAQVLTLSDSSGCLHQPDGLDQEQLDWVRQRKANGQSLDAFPEAFGGHWYADATPWEIQAEVAIPCATQNEVHDSHVKALLDNGLVALIEGANMPLTNDAQTRLRDSDALYAPGKASNAGGVAVSGLEISQDLTRSFDSRNEIDQSLQRIMGDIHDRCTEEGRRDGRVDYAKGANIAGFRKVADAMIALGAG